MSEPNPHKKKTARYMDFISRKPEMNSDPLASRPVPRPAPKPKPKVEKVQSVADQIPQKGAARPAVAVKRQETKPFISRKPATSRDLYPETEPETPKSEPKLVKSADGPMTATHPTEKTPDNNAYALGGKSPFLPYSNYAVDKRPLSNSIPEKKDGDYEKLSFLAVNEWPQKSDRRKNVYKDSKKENPKDEKAEEKDDVKVVDDFKEKHGLPTWLIIIITIILGAATGAGVYYLLPK